MRNYLTLLYANNKGAEQPEHLRSLISDVVVRSLKNLIFKLASFKIEIFYLVIVV